MKTPKIYLETSIFNFVFADDAPDKKADTLKLFEEIKKGKWKAYTSDYSVDELNRAQEPRRSKMRNVISQFNVEVLPYGIEIEKLADTYIAEKMIPQKYAEDALHIATASVHGLDVIVSWNFKHIVKVKTITLTESINLKFGYKRILINSPTEVIEND
jgi:predicted nucleic acid-binding protein